MKEIMKEIIMLGDKEGFEFSGQALQMLSKLENPIEEAKKLIQLAKERKLIITGGDVMKYIVCGELPRYLDSGDTK